MYTEFNQFRQFFYEQTNESGNKHIDAEVDVDEALCYSCDFPYVDNVSI